MCGIIVNSDDYYKRATKVKCVKKERSNSYIYIPIIGCGTPLSRRFVKIRAATGWFHQCHWEGKQ